LVSVILVRHGETDWNRVRRIQGSGSDTLLNEKGKQQAESLALRLKAERIQAIYSSPLRRSLDTALPIAQHHQMEVALKPDLRELNLGELEGVSIHDLGKSFDELLITGSQGEVLPRVAGGESLVELQQRAWSAVQCLVSQHNDNDGIIVAASHYFTIVTIICSVLGLPLTQISRLRVSPGSISVLVFDEPAPRLTLFNDTCHLTTD